MIFGVWLLVIFGAPIALIVAAYIGGRKQLDKAWVSVALGVTIFVHLTCSAISVFGMFAMIAGDPGPGSERHGLPGLVLFEVFGIFAFYTLLIVSVCLLIAGRWPSAHSKRKRLTLQR